MSIDLSLDRITKLLSFLPPYTRPTIHIAGTNGKGSVSALTSSILCASSPPYRVGRYNSPHLVTIYDCILIDDIPISPETYHHAKSRVDDMDKEHNIGASSFELLTSVALLIFEDEKVDIVVLEVGMGGRLDATNVIADECILVSALTAVDLDHQAFLGDTVAQIAMEKVAIARRGKPFVLGPQKHAEVEHVAQQYVARIGGELIPAIMPRKRDWDESIDGPIQSTSSLLPASFQSPSPQPIEMLLPCFARPLLALLPLQGEHQISNLATATTIVVALLKHCPVLQRQTLKLDERVTIDTVRRGIASVVWPGRLSFHKVIVPLGLSSSHADVQNHPARDTLILVDGAHNPASATTLSKYISQLLTIILPVRKDVSDAFSSTPTTPKRIITLTYLLALSHSPPKTPLQTLRPLLSPSNFPAVPDPRSEMRINVGLLRFTSPEGMPWVKAVPPSELHSAVSSILPTAEIWSPEPDGEGPQVQLSAALNWAAEKHTMENGDVSEGLVIVAGSLYLVADFYRLLRNGSISASG